MVASASAQTAPPAPAATTKKLLPRLQNREDFAASQPLTRLPDAQRINTFAGLPAIR